jgi:hypothetical protein
MTYLGLLVLSNSGQSFYLPAALPLARCVALVPSIFYADHQGDGSGDRSWYKR